MTWHSHHHTLLQPLSLSRSLSLNLSIDRVMSVLAIGLAFSLAFNRCEKGNIPTSVAVNSQIQRTPSCAHHSFLLWIWILCVFVRHCRCLSSRLPVVIIHTQSNWLDPTRFPTQAPWTPPTTPPSVRRPEEITNFTFRSCCEHRTFPSFVLYLIRLSLLFAQIESNRDPPSQSSISHFGSVNVGVASSNNLHWNSVFSCMMRFYKPYDKSIVRVWE